MQSSGREAMGQMNLNESDVTDVSILTGLVVLIGSGGILAGCISNEIISYFSNSVNCKIAKCHGC